ncbi:MAG TPA: hypothetical protein VK695_16285 [Steroidobacteraceae bacterium]|jgi:hypothetical protein|nr:hypothetical protein [Steroidobacteraceae bacterium]
MPRYEVTVQGRGIALPMETSVAIGFFKLVQLRSADPRAAEVRAIERVRADWESSAHALRNRGGAPALTIASIGLLSWWHRLLGAPQGYIFFSDNDELQAASRHRFDRP